jgi:O-antigen/teichoic acid export membrane protein
MNAPLVRTAPSSAVAQTLHTGAGILVLQGLAFITSVLIARGLGPELQGRFQLVMAIAMFVTMIATLGLDEAVAYVLPRFGIARPAKVFGVVVYVFGLTTAVACVLGVGFYSAADGFAAALGLSGGSYDLRFLLVLLPVLMLLAMGLAVLRGLGRSEWRAYIYYYLVGLLFLGAILVSWRGGLTSAEAYWARVASVAAGAAVALVLVFRSIPAGREFLERTQIRQLHSFASWVVLVGIFQYAVEQPLLDLILVSRFDTAAAVGLYFVGAKVAAVAAIGGLALNVVMAPDFSRSVAEADLARLQSRHRAASKWMAIGTVICGIGIIVLHRPVLAIFGGEYLAAATILLILAGGQIAAGLLGVNTPVLLAAGFAKLECLLTAAACALLLAGAILLGQSFGAAGVAGASAGTTMLLALSRRIAVERFFRRHSAHMTSR